MRTPRAMRGVFISAFGVRAQRGVTDGIRLPIRQDREWRGIRLVNRARIRLQAWISVWHLTCLKKPWREAMTTPQWG
ncbi:hypothetical protein B7486_04030 [cyanobacterium TDX16]|nr:hypothetical protein B7486_04030 [cyanobacterium TDX16]